MSEFSSVLIRGASPIGLPDWLARGGPTPRSAHRAHSLSLLCSLFEITSSLQMTPPAVFLDRRRRISGVVGCRGRPPQRISTPDASGPRLSAGLRLSGADRLGR